MSGISDAEVREWLRASCVAQGVANVVTDPATLAAVAMLLTGQGGRPTAGAKGARRAAPGAA
jgi:hypothetical protein